MQCRTVATLTAAAIIVYSPALAHRHNRHVKPTVSDPLPLCTGACVAEAAPAHVERTDRAVARGPHSQRRTTYAVALDGNGNVVRSSQW
ncbi:MAG TPA: hypothetical protein VGH62_11980 [Bradyrhizobium sp.]|jgi:hypothetical protein